MLTEAEDHDIASNNDGLAIRAKSASTPERGRCLRETSSALPRHMLAHRESRWPGGSCAIWVCAWATAGGWETQRNADRANVQAEREELRDAAENHDDGNHQVDDTTEIRGDMLAWGHLQYRDEGQAGGFSLGGALGRAESSRPDSSELFFLLSRARESGSCPTHKLSEKSILGGRGLSSNEIDWTVG